MFGCVYRWYYNRCVGSSSYYGRLDTAKRKTKKQQFSALHDFIVGKPKGRADGSITTHPTIPCADVLEAVVLTDCQVWLDQHGVVHDRNNVGKFEVQISPGKWGWRIYGIIDGGDVMGCLSHNGRHFEIEMKRGRGGLLTKGQQKRKFKILSNNGIYLIVHSAEELEKLFLPFLERE